ncbi:MAG: DUF1275 domain-containing protein [Clostridia bacterium]|nr:DUF1275 domain-containing protein [Clostridia bacterium]
MKKRRLKPDAVIAVTLSFVGGLLDVYCLYNFDVYATLHTGNMIKLITNLLDGNFVAFFDTLLVLFSFGIGIFLTNIYASRRKRRNEGEMFLISFVLILMAFAVPNDGVPGELSAWKRLAAALIGLEGAFLIHCFMRFGEYSYSATTMTANINRMVTVLHKRVSGKDKTQNYAIAVYLMIFAAFTLGVACGYGYMRAIPNWNEGWLQWYGHNLILLAPMACMLALWAQNK